MDKNKYDDFDKLFQSRLKNDQIVKEDWNTPPQSVFEGAIEKMEQKQKGRNRFLFIWFLASVILFGLIYFSISTNQKINQLENTVAQLQIEKNKEQNNPVNPNNANDINTINSDRINQKSILDESVLESKKVISDKTKHLNADKIYTDPVSSFISSEETKIQELIVQDLPAESNLELLETIASRPRYAFSNSLLPGRAGKLENMEEDRDLKKILKNPVAIEKKEKSKIPFSIYAMSGINASTIRMTNTEGASFSLTGYEKYYSDVYAGLGLEVDIHSNFALDINASYNRMNVKSTFVDEISYLKNNEIIDNQGNIYYNDNYDVFTVMGRQSGTLSLALGSKEIDDQEILTNESQIENSFRTLGISIGAMYKINQNKRFSFELGGGATYHHLLSMEEKMETSIFHKNGLMMNESLGTTELEKANNNYLSLYANLRLGYEISSNNGLKLDLSTAHSIGSIRKTVDLKDSKTYINNLRFAILFYHRIAK